MSSVKHEYTFRHCKNSKHCSPFSKGYTKWAPLANALDASSTDNLHKNHTHKYSNLFYVCGGNVGKRKVYEEEVFVCVCVCACARTLSKALKWKCCQGSQFSQFSVQCSVNSALAFSAIKHTFNFKPKNFPNRNCTSSSCKSTLYNLSQLSG